MLGILIVVSAVVAALCAVVFGLFFGLAHLIHETVWPSEKVDDIAPLVPLALFLKVIMLIYANLTYLRIYIMEHYRKINLLNRKNNYKLVKVVIHL